jgi:hypothetical protein
MQYTVDDIIEDSPAASSQIQVGDRLRMVSSAFDSSVQNQACQSPRHQERVSHLGFTRPVYKADSQLTGSQPAFRLSLTSVCWAASGALLLLCIHAAGEAIVREAERVGAADAVITVGRSKIGQHHG